MNPLFQKLMGDAARLTGQGDLKGATEAIQQALQRMSAGVSAHPPAGHSPVDADVIDVEAKEVRTPMASAWIAAADALYKAEKSSAQTTTARAAPQPARAPERPFEAPRPGLGQVLRGTHVGPAGQRDWRLYVPPHATGKALPLVVMLHGCTQDPDDFAAGTGMDETAREQGFFVLYPAQAQSANPQRCWNWFKHNHQQRDQGEPALIAGMTRQIMREHGIDPSRVYVAGLSAGGAMAAILGQAYPDLYAAVGIHSGLAAGAASDLPSALAAMNGGTANGPLASHGLADLPGMRAARPMQAARKKPVHASRPTAVPTIVFHGDQDHTVHPVNADHIIAACTPAASNDDAARPSEERARSANGRSYTRRRHADADGKAVAEHWVVHGAGHAWSGGSARGSYTDATGPDATREMLRFFFANPRRDVG